MLLSRTARFALAAMLAVTSITLTAHAEQRKAAADAAPTVNLSNAQVFQIQGLIQAQSRELRSLYQEVQTRRESLETAIAANDPVNIGMAVLALDASEKALENTKQANQRNLLSLLNENQKQLVKTIASKSTPASE